MREINLDTNPLDQIGNGERFIVIDGQLRMLSPIFIDETGELFLDPVAHLILEDT